MSVRLPSELISAYVTGILILKGSISVNIQITIDFGGNSTNSKY